MCVSSKFRSKKGGGVGGSHTTLVDTPLNPPLQYIILLCIDMKYLYESAILGTPRDVPKGYSRVTNVSVLRGPNFCKHCLCAPCVPDFLRGACAPPPPPSPPSSCLRKKAYALQKILEMSSTLGVWQDEDY